MGWLKRFAGSRCGTDAEPERLLAAADIQRRLQRYTEPAQSAHESDGVWLQDAVWYAAHGRWFGPNEAIRTTPGDLLKITEITQKMRRLAGEGKYGIWGKPVSGDAHRRIPAEFWTRNQVDVLRLLADGNPKNVCTEATASPPSESYSALRVSKLATERLWPNRTSDQLTPHRSERLALAD